VAWCGSRCHHLDVVAGRVTTTTIYSRNFFVSPPPPS
jgi:hypothetical protein